LADGEVNYCGQPIAMVLATTARLAEAAAKCVTVDYDDHKEPAILNLADAEEHALQYPGVDTKYERGDVEVAITGTEKILEGEIKLSTQKHFYMETQSTYVEPGDEDSITVYTATQGGGLVVNCISKALNIPHHAIHLKMRRAGGAFGGKLSRNLMHSTNCAVAAHLTQQPVKLVLSRNTDMEIVGGRHDMTVAYKVGFTEDAKLIALDVDIKQDGGFASDLSGFCNMACPRAVDQTYYIPHYRTRSRTFRTNKLSKTAVRGPGEIQGSYIMEEIIDHIAHELKITSTQVRDVNHYPEDEPEKCVDPGGKPLTHYTIPRIWKELKAKADFDERQSKVHEFNAANNWKKRGIAITPVKYEVGCGMKTAAVSIFPDGSVLLSHAGSEMGQGLFTKCIQTAAYTLGKATGTALPLDRIRNHDTDSFAIPDPSPTGGSVGSESSAEAIRRACTELVERLEPFAEKLRADGKPADFNDIVAAANGKINLQATGAFEDGGSLSYHNWGAAVSEVEVDVLTGETSILRSDMIYDCGKSLNPAIDFGQAEGAFMMGVGFLLREEIIHADDGRLVSNGTWEYKIPSRMDVPLEWNIEFLKDSPFPKGILTSKASGEPPLVLSTSITSAIRQATGSARKDVGLSDFPPMMTPCTPQRIQESTGHRLVEGSPLLA